MGHHAKVRRRRPWPVFLAAIQVVAGLAAGLPPWAFPLLLAGPAVLLWQPKRVEAVTAVTLLGLALGIPPGPFVPSTIVSIVYAVVRGRRMAAWLSVAGLYLGWLAIALLGWRDFGDFWSEARAAGLAVLVVLIAEFIDSRRHRAMAYRQLYQEEQRRKKEEERLRIARELHDVLAHSLSLITVRASVALELMDSNPEEVRASLLAIKQASKSGLDEVRTVLHGIRADAPRKPAPDLDQLTELVSSMPGLDVTLTRSGSTEPVPAAAGLAAYRIVQEALTNVLRHSRARSAVVHLHQTGSALLIGVSDDGPASGPPGENGNGLIGIIERAGVLGGVAQAGPDARGGFSVQAALPFRGTR
jgi:signal transduction histidine kinase